MNNTQLILKFKMFAKNSYDYLTETYEEIKDLNDKRSRKIMKAQITIWAGIYNRDYKEYRKGVDAFKQLTDEEKTNQDKNAINIYMKKGEDDTEEWDKEYTMDWFDKKQEFYKNLYNDLPKGYFKKK
jgi:hypothetical protein